MDISELNANDLIAGIAPSLGQAFLQFQKDNVPLDDAGRLIAGSQYVGVTLKGGGRFAGDLWLSIRKEFEELLCGDGGKYDDLRKRFSKVTKENQALFVTQASVIVGTMVGVQAGLVTPILVWLLLATVRVGREATCAALRSPPVPPS